VKHSSIPMNQCRCVRVWSVYALAVVIPSLLDGAVRDAADRRGTSLDTLVSAALGEYLNSHHHRMYQISTSTALVEGVDKGTVSSRILLEHGDFGLGTFEDLDGEMVIVDGQSIRSWVTGA
jgi:acetolactate decarboxylase